MNQGNANEIARILENMLPDLSQRILLGSRAKAFSDTNFSWKNSALKLSEFYVETLNGNM